MTLVHAEAAGNISIAAVRTNNCYSRERRCRSLVYGFAMQIIIHINHINKIKMKEVKNMLEYDEYRLKLMGFEENINDLRDSL